MIEVAGVVGPLHPHGENAAVTGASVAAAPVRPHAAAAPGSTLVSALLSLDYWLVFVTLLIGCGAGLSVINNVGSLAQSLSCVGSGQCLSEECGEATGTLLVTLSSIANCTGRMAGGVASDGLKAHLHRPGFVAATLR